jgi:hypothetical protein
MGTALDTYLAESLPPRRPASSRSNTKGRRGLRAVQVIGLLPVSRVPEELRKGGKYLLNVLPLVDDAIRAVDVAVGEVLQEVVGVEATPSLPQLGDPWTHPVGRGAHGDGPGRREVGVLDEVVA